LDRWFRGLQRSDAILAAMRSDRSARRARPFALVVALGAAVVLAQTAGAAHQNKVITVVPDTVIQLTGTDIYCTVVKSSVGSAVACFHDPSGPSGPRKGYALAASDKFAAVEPQGSNTPVAEKLQPSLAGVASFSGGSASNTIVKLGLNDIAAVGGTHMAIFVSKAKGGGNAIGVIYLNGKDTPIPGTYTVGLSNQFITIVQFVTSTKTKVTYQHSVT
jgi:hypothetical protein